MMFSATSYSIRAATADDAASLRWLSEIDSQGSLSQRIRAALSRAALAPPVARA